MTTYLLIFRNASGKDAYLATTPDMAEDMPKWQAWIGNIAMQGKLEHTAPVLYDSSIVTKNSVSKGPHKEANSVLISGFLICKSDDLQEVEQWGKDCPILKYPDSSVEIRPLAPFPIH